MPTIGCRNLRPSEGLAVDIKGLGGLIIAPPSISAQIGRGYRFHTGSWAELSELPVIRADTLRGGHAPDRQSRAMQSDQTSRTEVGQRNDTLFRELLKHAPHCDEFDALLDVAETKNNFAFASPLPDSEVVATARSAWRYEQENRNWVGRSPRTVLTREELFFFAHHKAGGDALILWAYLDGQHSGRGAFTVDRQAMAAANVLPDWTAWRYRRTLDTLRALGLLVRVGGGERRADKTLTPHLYRLERPMAGSRQYATRTVFARARDRGPGGAR